MKSVLFVCTGNYYRSRYAEELFNFLAPSRCPLWHAVSSGCALHLGSENVGPISVEATRALKAKGVTTFDRAAARMPKQLTDADLAAADHVIVLDEDEHRPLMQERFAAWLASAAPERTEWWHVHDVDQVASDVALPMIDVGVDDLLQRLVLQAGEDKKSRYSRNLSRR